MVQDGEKRKLDDITIETGKVNHISKRSKVERSKHNVRIQGPGIFVSCVRGRERKAAFELIEILEDLVESKKDKKADSKSNTKVDNIEDQISSELQEYRNTKNNAINKAKRKTPSNFHPIFTDMECFFFISVSKPYDPIKLTYDFLEQVKLTGIAKSRFIHRLSPVQETCFADLEDIKGLAKRLIEEENFSLSSEEGTTFRVEIKMRLHDKISKLNFIELLANQMPSFIKTNLNFSNFVINVEIFRMTVGIGIVKHFDEYKKFNPIILAEQTKKQFTSTTTSSRVNRITNNIVQSS